jgi:hypothetical protein
MTVKITNIPTVLQLHHPVLQLHHPVLQLHHPVPKNLIVTQQDHHAPLSRIVLQLHHPVPKNLIADHPKIVAPNTPTLKP